MIAEAFKMRVAHYMAEQERARQRYVQIDFIKVDM